jgi:hypothetical protein
MITNKPIELGRASDETKGIGPNETDNGTFPTGLGVL